MPQRPRRPKQIIPLDQRLTEEAKRLRLEAMGTSPGAERQRLIERARQAEDAAQMQKWLASPRPPAAR